MSRSPKIPCLLVLAGIVLCGCAGNPLSIWKRDVSRFVADEGGGDPSSLRWASPSGDRFDSVAVGKSGSSRAAGAHTSTHSVILGVVEAAGARWTIFLVGVEQVQGVSQVRADDRTTVKSIRAAAVSFVGGEPQWREGESVEATLEAYLSAQQPHTDGAPEPSTHFPAPGDRFELSMSGGAATVRHAASGATWNVSLAD